MRNNSPGPFTRFWRHLLDPQVTLLWILGLIAIGLILFLGSALAPFFVALVLAYILEGLVRRIARPPIPRWVAVLIVFIGFMAVVVGLFLWLVPLLVKQLSALVAALPFIAKFLQNLLVDLQQKYAANLDPTYLQNLIPRLSLEVEAVAKSFITSSLDYLPNLIGILVYLFLVPLLVLLFLKDKQRITDWFSQFLPENRDLFSQIIKDIDQQMSNFFRGKLWELVIISVVSVVTFLILDFRFAVLLGLISGISVLIPYVGVFLATIPIVLVAFFQWGVSSRALPVILAYVIIQLIDGNILAPVLVGNLIRIHPAGIIFAIFVCGHLWGILGVILAFPVAIVVKSILDLAMPYIRRRAMESEAHKQPPANPE